MLRSRTNRDFSRRGGFTLVELLVVITIIGILIMMLLPAVNSAREQGRFMDCKNNMKQLGTAALAHEQAQEIFPTGGWGWFWEGDPDCGFGKQQPGGWIYNILPHTDRSAMHDLGRGGSATAIGAGGVNKVQAIIQMIQTPWSLIMCPTRRRASLYPYPPSQARLAYNQGGIPTQPINVARTDYAVNVGDFPFSEYGGGPNSASQTDQNSYFGGHTGGKPQFAGQSSPDMPLTRCRGISFEQSTIRKDDVRDGLSQTLLIGEKYLAANAYGNGTTSADNETAYVGMDNDIGRTTCCPPKQDRWGDGTNGPWAFGSAHPNACNFVLCDGAVISINYAVDAENFRRLGTRDEGPPSAPADMTKL
jgi:prepilin-type N-terminal cleavage/methylation domain-containing protein